MKTTLHKNPLFYLFSITLLLFSCTEKTSEDTPKKNGLEQNTPTEDRINLERHPVDTSYGNLKIELSQYCILVDSAKALPREIDTINNVAIEEFKKMAMALAPGYNGRYILGINIIYGLNNSLDKMLLYYEPVFLKYLSEGKSDNEVKYQPMFGTKLYQYIDSTKSFSAASESAVTQAANNYSIHVTFKTAGNKYFREFLKTDSNDAKGDVTSIIYPLQELDSILIANKVDDIVVINAGDIIQGSLKHSLLLGPGLLDHKMTPIFYKKYGNLSHLCPPSCGVTPKLFFIK